ncbi:hypothetical protein DGWBC_0526 [Dehalogenimonas sp. WBC-2]|nr:hypothetical protein DGWBC_0526 [Dehalogenimonas sp. WBC-2]
MGASVINGGWVLPLVLVGLGVLTGTYGTLIGVGGALILVPALFWLYPDAVPQVITAISLLIVLVNALGGTYAYARQRRIDYVTGTLFAAATIPGVILGVLTLQFIPRATFALIFALMLVAVGIFLFLRSERQSPFLTPDDSRQHRLEGFILSLGVGYIAGLLGIGGGILHVPILIFIMGFSAHKATATSIYILSFTALAGSLTHLIQGSYDHDWSIVLWLAVGVMAGSQLGARLSQRLHGKILVRLLAIALVVTGLRLALG